eukprot:GHUV01051571.1.p1 GENE.GHUV01051571.1~~GHUV01051571.1.p1  ORF type:complete len:171 (+),score=57.22 GHUV01051571.1:26-538(+)
MELGLASAELVQAFECVKPPVSACDWDYAPPSCALCCLSLCCRFFLKRAPFTVAGGALAVDALRPAYQVLDAFHHSSVENYPSVTTITAESKHLQEFQDLFELYVSDYLVLQRCSEELLYLKSLWDMVRVAGACNGGGGATCTLSSQPCIAAHFCGPAAINANKHIVAAV